MRSRSWRNPQVVINRFVQKNCGQLGCAKNVHLACRLRTSLFQSETWCGCPEVANRATHGICGKAPALFSTERGHCNNRQLCAQTESYQALEAAVPRLRTRLSTKAVDSASSQGSTAIVVEHLDWVGLKGPAVSITPVCQRCSVIAYRPSRVTSGPIREPERTSTNINPLFIAAPPTTKRLTKISLLPGWSESYLTCLKGIFRVSDEIESGQPATAAAAP